ATLAFVVAPTVFRTAPSRAVAGTIFGAVLRTSGTVQIVLAFVAVAAVVILQLSGDLRPKTGFLRAGVLLFMLLLVCGSHFFIGPAIERERASIANFDSMPPGVPARARFESLHKGSVMLGAVTLVAGAALLVVKAAML